MPRILHLASFRGNIGDNASHIGLGHILSSLFDTYSLDRIEIREFYKNVPAERRKNFDADMADYINTYDLFIIGGGGFLDYWVPDSETGTTLDMGAEFLNRINIPTMLTSVGCYPHREVPEGNQERFKRFLDIILNKKDFFLALRNDGSKYHIQDILGSSYFERIPEVADHGFFYQLDPAYKSYTDLNRYVAMNFTYDQLAMKNTHAQPVSRESYYHEMARYITYLAQEHNYHVLLIPHIYSDLKAFSMMMEHLPDRVIRERVSVFQCMQGDEATHRAYDAYNQSDFVVASRLHSNICNLSMGKRMIGLASLDRVDYVYKSLGLDSMRIIPDSNMFAALLEKTEFYQNAESAIYAEGDDANCDDSSLSNIDRIKTHTMDIYKKALGALM